MLSVYLLFTYLNQKTKLLYIDIPISTYQPLPHSLSFQSLTPTFTHSQTHQFLHYSLRFQSLITLLIHSLTNYPLTLQSPTSLVIHSFTFQSHTHSLPHPLPYSPIQPIAIIRVDRDDPEPRTRQDGVIASEASGRRGLRTHEATPLVSHRVVQPLDAES